MSGRRGYVAVEPPGASGGGESSPGWDVAIDLDLTGLTSATLTSGSTTTVTRAAGGAAVFDVWASNVSNTGGTITAGAAGIRCEGADSAGSVSALTDIATKAGLTLPGDVMHGLAVSLYLTNITDLGTASNAWRAGISADLTRFSAGTSNTVQGIGAAGPTQNRRIATNESFTTWVSGEAVPSGAIVVTLLILGGDSLWAFYGTSAPSDADLDALTGAVHLAGTITADVTDAPAGTRFGAALYAGIQGQQQAGVTWTRTVVRRRRLS